MKHVRHITELLIIKEDNMENELRYYLNIIKASMAEPTEEEKAEGLNDSFKPKYIVTAAKLPTGAIELAVNTENIAEKIDYILEAYDDDMRLRTNTDIVMQNIMVV